MPRTQALRPQRGERSSDDRALLPDPDVPHPEPLLPLMHASRGWGWSAPIVHGIDREADSVGPWRAWDDAGHRVLVRANNRRVRWREASRLRLQRVQVLDVEGAFRDCRKVEFQGCRARPSVAETEGVLDRPAKTRRRGCRHSLSDMLVIAVTAVLCAADSWSDVRDFGRAKLKWFKTFLDLPHGIPSQDTFERVFARLDPDAFERCFMAWTKALAVGSGGQLVAIDGERLRRSFEHAWSASTATHLGSAFASANATVFAQLAVDSKENEIVAIPRLLELLDLQGATVTIDAIGCQTSIAQQIVDQGGDDVLSVKDNQPTLARALKADLDDMIRETFKGIPHDFCETVHGDHGRIETRRVWTTPRIDWLGPERDRWSGLRSVAVVEATRDAPLKGISRERRYYISTLDGHDAKRFAAIVRNPWGIENRLHDILDVSFAEDPCRVRKGHAAENFSRLRRIALNLLRRETTQERGIKGKRLNAAWDRDDLLKLLTG